MTTKQNKKKKYICKLDLEFEFEIKILLNPKKKKKFISDDYVYGDLMTLL